LLKSLCSTGLLVLLLGCSQSSLGPAQGPYQLHQISDGDSFILTAANGERIRIRLAGIDAPERTQPYARRAQEALETLLRSGPISLEAQKKDRYDRWISIVRVAGVDAGLAQLDQGWAWYFKRYRKDLPQDLQAAYEAAEEKARAARRGLWAWEGSLEPPWVFRERQREDAGRKEGRLLFDLPLTQRFVTTNATGHRDIQAFYRPLHRQTDQLIASFSGEPAHALALGPQYEGDSAR